MADWRIRIRDPGHQTVSRLFCRLIGLHGLFDSTQTVIDAAEVCSHVAEILAHVGAKLAHVGADAADLHAQGNRDSDDGPENPRGISTRHYRQTTTHVHNSPLPNNAARSVAVRSPLPATAASPVPPPPSAPRTPSVQSSRGASPPAQSARFTSYDRLAGVLRQAGDGRRTPHRRRHLAGLALENAPHARPDPALQLGAPSEVLDLSEQPGPLQIPRCSGVNSSSSC